MLAGVWIGAAMGITGLIGITVLDGFDQWQVLGDILWNTSNSFTLVAIPLFILMGEIILRSGISERLYSGLAFWFARVPGGLLHTNIFGSAIFSALSGSSTATAITVGTVAIPEMDKRAYDGPMTLGSLAAGGCLGILIPPSIVMIVYGTIAQVSILQLFMAGVVPGLIVIALFMGYIFIRAVANPELAPCEHREFNLPGIWNSMVLVSPAIVLLAAVIGGMYFGIVTPTEAAALGCAGAVAISIIFRQFRWVTIKAAISNSVTTTCVVMFIIINSQVLMFAMASAGIPKGLALSITEFGLPKWQFFVLLFLMYFVLGMFLDGISMMLLTVPVLFASVQQMGFDGVWFGVALVIMIEIGQITPPMGLNLFAIHSISGKYKFSDVAKGALPYTALLGITIVLIYIFPELVLFLPEAMIGG